MSTQNTTTSNQSTGLTFDPGSLSLYKGLTGAGGNVLKGYMNNPFGNAFYKMGAAESQKGANALGQQNINAMQQIARTSGLGGNAGTGWLQAQKARTGRANQSLRSQAQMSNIQAALQRQIGATGMGMSYSPLMTGQTSSGKTTQETSGLGTWLPQVLGAGLGMATSMATMGAGGGAASGGGGGGGPQYASPSDIMPKGFAGASVGNSPFGMPLSGNNLQMGNPFAASMMQPQ